MGVRCAVCGVRCAVCGVRRAGCGVRCGQELVVTSASSARPLREFEERPACCREPREPREPDEKFEEREPEEPLEAERAREPEDRWLCLLSRGRAMCTQAASTLKPSTSAPPLASSSRRRARSSAWSRAGVEKNRGFWSVCPKF